MASTSRTGSKRAALLFLVVAMLSLAAAVAPLLKGNTVNGVFLGTAVVWLVIAIAVGRRADSHGDTPAP